MNIEGFDLVIVRRGQYRNVRQLVRYRAGAAAEYLCPNCGGWHTPERMIYDTATETYHGIDCDGEGAIQARIARARHARAAQLAA